MAKEATDFTGKYARFMLESECLPMWSAEQWVAASALMSTAKAHYWNHFQTPGTTKRIYPMRSFYGLGKMLGFHLLSWSHWTTVTGVDWNLTITF